ncbi:MAG: carbamoyltransferase HypF [Synechococcaceae cyanobacterium]
MTRSPRPAPDQATPGPTAPEQATPQPAAPDPAAPGHPAQAAAAPVPDLMRLRLECRGVVQGVGFRPALARLAGALGVTGTALNVAGAVHLDLWGERQALETLLLRLPGQLPEAAQLEPLQPRWSSAAGVAPEGLTIGSGPASPLKGGLFATALVADRAPCGRCLAELADPRNRRFGYPFISCCDCGPRYSIATEEPFCRSGTTLAGFPLCAACQAEFEDPRNRRFHAETLGCWDCGPRLRLLTPDGLLLAAARPSSRTVEGLPEPLAEPPSEPLAESDAEPFAEPLADPLTSPLAEAVALLRAGAILALQGVGGFQLLVLAQDAAAVARLRQRKQRPHKPFALLVDAPSRVRSLLRPCAAELQAMGHPAAPIVLLPCPASLHGSQLPGVAPGAPALGVMLPASPLHWLLARAVAAPLVATSGTRGGEPLCRDREEALRRLSGIADAFLVHDRPVARRLDDSVLQLIDGLPALLRRSRGYAPEPLRLPQPRQQPGAPLLASRPTDLQASRPAPDRANWLADATASRQPDTTGLLALGGDLKAAPALALGDQVWLAPHLGDLEDRRCLNLLEEGLAALAERGAPRLAAVVGDRHPDSLGRQLAARWLQPLAWIGVQHHLAHGLSVAAEHGLELPLLALCADGLGYGAPELGQEPPLWGCELFWITPSGAERLACLRPLALPGGDRAQREPRRLALGLLAELGPTALEHPGAQATLAAFAPAERQLLLQAIAHGLNCPRSSSLGRLFDAVASLLDLAQRLSFEGQGGLLLQGAADSGEPLQGLPGYALPLRPAPGLPLGWLDWQPLLIALLADRAAGRPVATCARRFHWGLSQGLAQLLVTAAGPRACRLVVLAGGCFQNALLLKLLVEALRRAGLRPHWAERLPSNDGGLALGQIWAARLGLSITPAVSSRADARDVPCRERPDPGHPPPPAAGG